MQKYLQHAINCAKAHEYDGHTEYYLCAVIVRGGSIVSIGYNRRSTNKFVEHYTDKVRGSERDYCLSTHAEMDAIGSVRKKFDLRGSKIYVARIRPVGSTDGDVGMARPCEICQEILYAYGFKRAIYTIDDDTYGVMRITESNNPILGDKVFDND